jgi:DNA-binding MarR family transcriptional regulator
MTTPAATPPTAPVPPAPTRRPIGPLAAELRMAIMRTSRRIRQERSTDDVTPGQYSVLNGLDVLGPLTPRELAEREKVQPPSMTRTVSALEDLGLVSRTDHPTDGRQVLVALTPAGVTVVKETRKRRDAWLAKRLAELGPDEREVLHRAAEILGRVASR